MSWAPFFAGSLLCSEMILSSPRVSVCELEADTVAADIVNRLELSLGKCLLYCNSWMQGTMHTPH